MLSFSAFDTFMSSFNNATNYSHQLAAAAVVARNLQQQQQVKLSPNNFKGHSLLPFQSPISSSKPNSVGSLPSSPSPPPTQIVPPTTMPAFPITPQSFLGSHCSDNLSLLSAQQKLSSIPPQSSSSDIINPSTSIGDHPNGQVDSDGAATAASMAAAAAFSPGIPAFLQHIIHGKSFFVFKFKLILYIYY